MNIICYFLDLSEWSSLQTETWKINNRSAKNGNIWNDFGSLQYFLATSNEIRIFSTTPLVEYLSRLVLQYSLAPN